jgi:hypothetical protein
MEDVARVSVEAETEAARLLGSFNPREYDTLMMVKLLNGSHLNHVFEQMVVAYAPCPFPGSKASQATRDKQKAEVSKKPTAKRAKTGMSRATPSKMAPPLSRGAPPSSKTTPLKKIGAVKVVCPRVKSGPQGTSEIEKPSG